MWGACDYGSNFQAGSTTTGYQRQSTRTRKLADTAVNTGGCSAHPMCEAPKSVLVTETKQILNSQQGNSKERKALVL